MRYDLLDDRMMMGMMVHAINALLPRSRAVVTVGMGSCAYSTHLSMRVWWHQ